MSNFRRKLKAGSMVLGSCMLLGISATSVAQTELQVENDGLTVKAIVSSDQDVLSTFIRVVGPGGFVFEDRIEDGAIQWIPDGDLADGRYSWEARAVTVKPGAPMQQLSVAQPAPVGGQNGQADDQLGDSVERVQAPIEMPIERYFNRADKSVHVESGSFEVRDGWLVPMVDSEEGTTQRQPAKPGLIGSIAGAVIDFIFPSAQAQDPAGECSSPCDINSTGSAEIQINSDTNANTGGPWEVELEVNSADGLFQIGPVGGTAEPFRLEFDAPEDSLRINRFGNIGIGTGSPTQDLHISSGRPRIRLEDTDDIKSWYVKNSNAGRFEIAEVTGGTNPFTIDSGAPDGALHVASNGFVGIGTATPQRRLHILGNHIRIENAGSTWDLNPGSQGIWFNRDNPAGVFGILKLQNDAPANSIVATANGVGFGTDSPVVPLHVRRSGSGSDTNMFRLENDDGSRFQFANTRSDGAGGTWEFINSSSPGGADLVIRALHNAGQEFRLSKTGDLTILGSLTADGSTWPDYVFEPDYQLLSLDEVDTFIKENGHLPGLIPAHEAEKNGVDMTLMQKKLLEKVEEMTLYAIDQEKRINQLEAMLSKN